MKKLLRALGIAIPILLFFGGALLILFFFGSMGMFPLYVTRVIPVAGIAVMAAWILSASGYFSPKVKRGLGMCALLVCMGCVVSIGIGAYRESLATVDDRDLLLWQYEPFSEDNQLAALDGPASLELDHRQTLRLDGATALYPVYAAFVQAVYPEGEYPLYTSTADGNGQVACTGTIEAYERLVQGNADMIFAASPSQDQLDMAEEAGVELHLTPIGKEAFVFFINSRNPVTNLSVEEIQGIYTGEITNWSQVGGNRQSIRPFQRAENSGSQSALLRLMEGLPLLEPEEEERIAGMGGIIREVASYRNYQNAIGFSFRFYATEMVQNGDIRLLALNGVEPTRESIRNESYPITSAFYAVTASRVGEPPLEERSEAATALLQWILSQEGQELVERTGYVPIS